ncbi:Cytochrome P450 [Penicillium occitanis (nom. inval.)]|nr:Cytochrome P450 [Penicillium occitanis (nom. inval.)]PCG89636.1 hypothetical protein PENOC_105710 [Penicillium occitanis (nom. inval.)]
MTVYTIPVAAIVFALVYFVSQCVYRLALSPLRHFPGPFWAKVTDLWHAKLIKTGKEFSALYELHNRYGPVVRIGSSRLSVTDLTALRIIYKVGAPFPKTDYYAPFQTPGVGVDIFSERNEAIHGKFKRQFAQIYSASAVKDLDANIDNSIQRFIYNLQHQGAENIDLGKWVERLLFADCMCDLHFGQNLAYLDHDPEDRVFEEINRSVRQAHLSGMTPGWQRVINAAQLIKQRLCPGNTVNLISRSIEQFFKGSVGPCNNNPTTVCPNIASRLVRAQSAKNTGSLQDAEVLHLIQFGLIAGTTDGGTWLNSVFYHLMHNRHKLDKLVEELREKFQLGEIGTVCTAQQSATCTYLDAVLQESLRMFPALGSILPRETPSGGLDILGHHVPAGFTVGAPAFAIHRMEDIFGPEPFSFKPERWLEAPLPPDMSRFSMGFGLGSRTCLGRNLSWMIVPSVVLALDFEPPNPAVNWDVVSE